MTQDRTATVRPVGGPGEGLPEGSGVAAARADRSRGPTMSGPEPAVDLATIIDWVEGRLEPDVAAHVTDAAAREPRVREIVAWFRGFHRAAADLPLTDLPAGRRRVLRPAVGQGEQAPVEVVARALFDSRQDVPVADLRS